LVSGTTTDAQHLAAAAKDAESFGRIYDRHAGRLLARIRGAGVPSAAARDLLAETFAQAWIHRRRFRDPGDGSAYPWLAGIARNLVRNYFRTQAVETRARRRLRIELPPPEPEDVVAALDSREESRAARELLDGVDRPARRAVELRVIDELSYAEVAARLGCTPETARKRVSLALRAMRLAAEEKL
jgi:RNA polymerase sigma-70 factor (ECF subfamily)